MSIIAGATVTAAPGFQPRAAFRGQQTNTVVVRTAVVVEHRVNPLLPLAAPIDERVAQPDACAEIQDVVGRDPGLR